MACASVKALLTLYVLFQAFGNGEINYRLSQPQIYVDDGHLYFVPAEHRNLVLVANGTGKIILNDLELNKILSQVKNSTRDIKSLKRYFRLPSNSSRQQGLVQRVNQLEQQLPRLDQLDSVNARLIVVERQLTLPSNSTSTPDESGEPRQELTIPRNLRRRLTALERRVRNLASDNPCSTGPCLNAGTCIPTIFGPFCLCPTGWEGDRCQLDVNECSEFAGTGLGCQNGGACINLPGTYQCACRAGWIGIHCAQRSGDCSSGPGWELCGHGTCVNQHAGSRPYTCICEQGWKTDGQSPACNTDIDECNGPHPSCSKNPLVACINVPGSFHCGPCPFGYTGNGFHCSDVNECLQNNGGCSMNPMVQCINTVGSRTCGECPPGYIGNGISCQYFGMCQINNGGCHPLARCAENPVIGQSYVQCSCPAGYTGTGMGLHGCFPYGGGGTGVGPVGPGPGPNPCFNNPCLHGTCIAQGNSYICSCQPGFIGPTCSLRVDPCQSSPCQNAGTCQATLSGFICHCPNDFTGLRCEQQEQSCGGQLVGSEGTLRYPHDSSSSYGHNTNCMWWIRTDEVGKTLNLTFTRFHLEGGGACSFDWLQIHDGTGSSAPLIGKYCGESLPNGGSIASTHEAIFLWFRSDHSTVGLGFEFNWNTTDPVCGEMIEGKSHGSVSSPGYPGQYPHNRDCFWSISVSPSKRIQLVFATLQIETHSNCSYDYLEVRDGLEETAPSLAIFCNTTLPPPVVSSGPHLVLRFHTDSSASDVGFHVTYAEVPGIPGCGGVFTESKGVFASPQHPEPYAHGADCEYLIRLPTTDERILLTFLQFELESGPNCRYDHVEIYDGERTTSPLIGRFCERNTPPLVRSSTNKLLVRFRSDISISFGGFRAKYESVCGGTFSSPEALIRSPYYPGAYPKNRDCTYIISQPVNKAIRLDFQDFDIEGTNDQPCQFDFLEIRDGDTENSTLLGHFCGGPQATPEPIISTYNYLWIRFRTDGSIQNRGFLANYSTFDISCGGILRETHGVISSPGHPEVYPHGVQCSWIIRGVPGQVIRLNWVTFSLERNLRCRYDVVEIFDNSTLLTNTLNGTLIGRYCGQDLPPIITSSDYTMTIRFKSDHSVAHDGFMANYIIVNSSTVCGGNYFTEFGVVQSPGYPNHYPPGKVCVWTIKVLAGQQIMLNVTDFDLENGTNSGCIYDSLELRNGGYETSPLIGKYCGGLQNLPSTIPSFSNTLFLKFRSDSSRAGRGFKIFWDGTATGCGGTLKSPSGSIVSPNYPVSAGVRVECVWNIVVNQGSGIQFVFADLDVQRSTSCYGEFVELRDGPTATSPLIGKYCHAESVLALNSTSNKLRIKFVSSFGSTGRGFHASYQTICSREIRGHSGVIESPNFPQPYPHFRNCTWEIIVPLGNKVNMSFSHFAVEGPTYDNCRFDFVEISESATLERDTRTSLGRFCGTNIPTLIASTKDNVFVHFESDASVSRNGFRMEWVLNGCGGRILGSWGVVKSPNYPQPYPNAVECEWLITTELGSRVSLNIVDLDLEKADNCVFDYLKIYGGPTDGSPLLTQLCHKQDRNLVVTSHGNNMLIRFRSDSSVSGKGFYGWTSQMPGGCGGRMTAPTGYVYSPNWPQNYDHNDDCGWLIRVDPNHAVELSFLEFNIERHINCTYDHVAVYDGRSELAPLLLMACGNTVPEPAVIKSTGNEMYIRLKTDGSTSGKGFKANYTTACGARITGWTGDSIRELTSPGFPHFIYRMNCTWFLKGESPEDHVTLTFTHLDIQNTGNQDCDLDFVEVLDGEDLEAPSLGKYCFSRIPPAITSQGNGLVVRVLTQDSWGFGFRATYDFSSAACGGTLTSAEGSFMSPNYPVGYPASAECVWTIQASAGNRIALSFRRIDIESSDFCNSDFVEIHENDASGPLIGHFCGNEVPSNITAAEKLWVLFRTDAVGQAPGFMADYSLVHGNELSGSTGYVASPLFPLPNHVLGTYTWRIFVNQSQAIRITFDDFDFEHDVTSESCLNQLKIFDGFDEQSPELLYSCDRNLPEPVISTGNVVLVKFTKTYPRIGSLFQLHWAEVPLSEATNLVSGSTSNVTGCGGNVSVSEDGNVTTLLSPGYPAYGYLPNLRCEWTINSVGNHRVQLKIEDIDLESHATCMYDRVEVYDGENGQPNYVLNQTLCQREETGMILLSSGRTMRIIFITDNSVGRIGFNFSLSSKCGGIFRETWGRLTTPNYPANYGHSNCLWIINVRPGRTIGLTFQSLDIYRGTESACSTDQLILRNGGHAESPFLGQGRYCGNTIPTVPETSGNQLFVQFTAWTTGGRGFALIYNEISSGCGGQIHLTADAPDFVFSSPNYPQIPPPFSECEWIFTAPANDAVQLDFQLTFQLAYTGRCTQEGVEILDGGTRLSPAINTFCNEMPGTQKSTGNVLFVRYFSNINEPRNGFKAKASIARCGGTLSGWSGTIQSPGFPASYEPGLDCLWTFRGPTASYLTLTMNDLELSPQRRVGFGRNASAAGLCANDWVQITEENVTGIEAPRNWTLCGLAADLSTDRFVSSTNEIHVRFHSDSVRETKKGFKLSFRASSERCGGTLNSPSGIIQSIGYPRAYPHYRTCTWRIGAPIGRRIRLEFLDFDLEERIVTPTKSYCVDYVQVGQGRQYYGFQKFYNDSLCGSSVPPPVESTSNSMTIRFRTDGSVSHRGFKARYSTELPALCGGELTGDQGSVSSPTELTGTPNTTTSVICSWRHAGEANNATTILTITDLGIPPWTAGTPDCLDGYMKVSPSTSYGSYRWRSYCGQVRNQKTYLPGSTFDIAFEAKHLESTFNLTYQVVGCGGVLNGPNDTIQSPNFPSPYASNIECIWVLDYEGGSQIRLTFTDLDLEDHRDSEGCDRDHVVVRNGKYPSSPILGKYCGTNLPSYIISMSNEVWIEFHSDETSNGNRRGFRITAENMPKGCGGVVHKKIGSIRSPKASEANSRYPNGAECEWTIETVPGYMVNIVFTGRFEIEGSTNCTNDFVELSQKEGRGWKSIGRYCGRQAPTPINTTATSVKVLFRTNQAVDGDGFTLNWYSPCGGLYSDESGVIRSAHYDRYNHSYHVSPTGDFWSNIARESQYRVQTCDYTVQGNSSNDYIVLEFIPPFDVSVPSSEGWEPEDTTLNCPTVNVSVWEGNRTVRDLYPYGLRGGGIVCGTAVPEAFIGRGAVTITYNYLPLFESFGFRARYSIYQCGGVVTEPRSVQSPGHPFTSAPNMNCTWIVRAPPGKVVRFKFERLDLEFGTRCQYDSVRLYNGETVSDQMLGVFCGNLTEDFRRISSASNSMTIQFLTDWSVHHSGFLGSIDFTIGAGSGCGGLLNVSAGPASLRSPDTDNDGKYNPYLDCQWLVVGPEFQVLDLSFASFALEGSRKAGSSNPNDECPYDYLEIRDGPGPYGDLLGKLCGTASPPPISSSVNFMWINFVSDGSYGFGGFRAAINSRPSPCGPAFVLNATSSPGVLKSPSYPGNYGPNSRCRWTVDGARVNDEVDIRFIDLDLEPSPDCSKDRLTIRDISSSYQSPEGIGGPILFNGNRATDWRFRNLDIDTASILQNYRYCGSQTPPDFISVGRSLEITFETDAGRSGRGFQLEYKAAGCNRTYENPQGRIFSPEWPTYSPMFSNCIIVIRGGNGTFVSLSFNEFVMEESQGCTEAFFEVRENGQSGQVLARYCGSSLPNPVFGSSAGLWINYVTRLHSNRGFDVSYTTTTSGVGCGGDLFHTGGSLSSPYYPGNFSTESDCRWRVRVPAGLRVNLIFASFMIGGDCAGNFLEILSMSSHDLGSEPVPYTTYCPGDTPSPYNGATDMVMIHYKSSLNNTGMGWRIEFNGVAPN